MARTLLTSQQTPMISLTFSAMAGAKFSHPFPPEAKSQDLYKVVAEKLYPNFKLNVQPGCDDKIVFPFQLLLAGKVIPFNDSSPSNKQLFEEMKKKMNPRTIILVGEKMMGGNDRELFGMDALRAQFYKEFKSNLNALPGVSETQCRVCHSTKDCIQFSCPKKGCCNQVCRTCIPEHFAQKGCILPCTFCTSVIELDTFIPGSDFKTSYDYFEDLIEQQRNIDFQICKCGKFFINATMYARQECPYCKRWMCFFCNFDWDSTSMTNQKYTCSPTCTYQQYLVYELVEMKDHAHIKLPSARCCPKCSTRGMYGDKCRMHKCNRCSRDGAEYWFCFFCLKTKAECKELHPSLSDFGKCGEPVVQTYEVFPRIGS